MNPNDLPRAEHGATPGGVPAGRGHLAGLVASATPRPARSIRLNLERVVLTGVALTPPQSRAFRAALEDALRTLASAPGWQPPDGRTALPGAMAPAVHVGPRGDPVALGRDVARSVFSALRGLA